MELALKRPDRIVPEYSLTGDLLSYLRCMLQYRYYNGSALPPSRPVQMWYGEFIHGMLEAAFRLWDAAGGALPFPWPCTPLPDAGPPQAPPQGLAPHDLRIIGWPIEEALAHEGKRARSRRARISAYRRAEAAINLLGPQLFPLIADAEQKVIGTRLLPPLPQGPPLRSERYALHGVIDVLTNVELASAGPGNIVREAVEAACPGLTGTFEVIVDYKGSHRPATDESHWSLGEWQVQTYAWLRQRQQLAHPVAAGILIYVNELAPGGDDIRRLRSDIERGQADVAPERGSPDFYALQAWTPGSASGLSEAFRFRRALRVIPITEASIARATREFDRTVSDIESQVIEEATRGSILATWPPTSRDPETCIACDFRFFCPNPAASSPALTAEPSLADDDDL
ncbi:PD-(D/E)XK nuclease family protein [Stigmatella sp. ncwal1]|uniref:PD-(D/E)XK nuclease family protein n=1 Tax=Stigmatella ashevillensis TaxID=2995309 RepID=A0ABT5DIR7_9BACT|nr:PD-(D/E)XK nuclease family protein [Stigmatella ashevillena]MDC0713464.1 PD-(D/E)XK nuclease family protein [Stigmatella ashevillena]